MKFTRQYVILQATYPTGVIAFFNLKEDAIDFLNREKTRKPYETFLMYEKVEEK